MMMVIDCDTHVDETEATWDWLQPGEEEFRPTTAFPPVLDPARRPTRYWMVDGHRQPRPYRDDTRSQTTIETRDMVIGRYLPALDGGFVPGTCAVRNV